MKLAIERLGVYGAPHWLTLVLMAKIRRKKSLQFVLFDFMFFQNNFNIFRFRSMDKLYIQNLSKYYCRLYIIHQFPRCQCVFNFWRIFYVWPNCLAASGSQWHIVSRVRDNIDLATLIDRSKTYWPDHIKGTNLRTYCCLLARPHFKLEDTWVTLTSTQ